MAEIEDTEGQIEQAQSGHPRYGHPTGERMIDRGTGKRSEEGETSDSEGRFGEGS